MSCSEPFLGRNDGTCVAFYKKSEAQQMLAEIYNWFTEGFDSGDLLEAKTLLEELS
jgi:hypothetical protein